MWDVLLLPSDQQDVCGSRKKEFQKEMEQPEKRWVNVCKCRRRIFLREDNPEIQLLGAGGEWHVSGRPMVLWWCTNEAPANCDVNSKQQNEWNYGKTERTSVWNRNIPCIESPLNVLKMKLKLMKHLM